MDRRAIAKKAEQFTNQTFLSLLNRILDDSYFKSLPKHVWCVSLGVPLKQCLYKHMENSEYGENMKCLFQHSNEDAIQNYHQAYVTEHAPIVLQQVLKQQHPHYQVKTLNPKSA